MSAIDSSNVENALVAKLLADVGVGNLGALMPDGVYIDEAPAGATRFVLVSLVDEHDTPIFGGRGFEDYTFLVKAVAKTSTTANVKAAAARIDALLDPQPPDPPATLTITGYSLKVLRRVARVRTTEVDGADEAIRWQHRGGRYQVLVAPTST